MSVSSPLRRLAPPRPAAPTATWYAVAGPNGDLTWRVESPAHVIGAKVHYIPEENGAESVLFPNSGKRFPWHIEMQLASGREITVRSRRRYDELAAGRTPIREARAVYPIQEGDVAIWTRPLVWLAAHMLQMREHYGIRVVAETDDNYLSPPSRNVLMQTKGWDREARDLHVRALCAADSIIVSTDYLAELYWHGLTKERGKARVPPIHVCRNHIDSRYVPTETVPPRPDGRLRIGYMGSDSHVWDISLIYGALMEAQEMGHEIVFVGIDPKRLNPKYLRDKRQDWGRLSYTHVPWVNAGYRGFALPLDIGFAPLMVNEHTLGKSDIKVMEYGLSGAAAIAQNCLVYNRTMSHGETVLFASSPNEFRDRMVELIKSESFRKRLVTNMRQYISEERMIDNHTDEWREAVFA